MIGVIVPAQVAPDTKGGSPLAALILMNSTNQYKSQLHTRSLCSKELQGPYIYREVFTSTHTSTLHFSNSPVTISYCTLMFSPVLPYTHRHLVLFTYQILSVGLQLKNHLAIQQILEELNYISVCIAEKRSSKSLLRYSISLEPSNLQSGQQSNQLTYYKILSGCTKL